MELIVAKHEGEEMKERKTDIHRRETALKKKEIRDLPTTHPRTTR